jgi:hypothetical protein
MVNHVGIYGFCLFKKKNVVRADVSVYINMYGFEAGCGKRNFKRRRQLFTYTFFYQCCVAFCGKSCAEEEDGSIVYSSSSFMLRVKTVWVLMPNCSIVATTSDAGRRSTEAVAESKLLLVLFCIVYNNFYVGCNVGEAGSFSDVINSSLSR